MKQIFTLLLVVSISIGMLAQNEETIGFDGDNFSLEGTLELFKNSKTIEDFEKNLNKEDNYINNLDLNQNGQTDYVMVKDNLEGDFHAIVLQVVVSENETQDLAVIEIEKTGNEEALLQIIGDEDVYGDVVIVEPYNLEGQSDSKGPNAEMQFIKVTVNVWFWPSVRYLYHPGYMVWTSPWRWNHYPLWWKPWRPKNWNVFHPLVVKHHHSHYYHRVHTHRVVNAHKIYTPKRKTSAVVASRTKMSKSRVVLNNNGLHKKVTKKSVQKSKPGIKAANANTSDKKKTHTSTRIDKTKKTAPKVVKKTTIKKNDGKKNPNW